MRRPIATKVNYIEYLLHINYVLTIRGIYFNLQELPVPHTVHIPTTFTVKRLINIVLMDAVTHTPLVHAVTTTLSILIFHCE